MRFNVTLCFLLSLISATAAAQTGAERHPELRSPLFKDSRYQADQNKWVGDPVTMSLKDADLVEVLRTFARLGDMNMILHPGIRGSVTVELKEVPWDQALSMILKINGLGMDITSGTLRVAPPEALRQMIQQEASQPQTPISPIYRVSGSLTHLKAATVAELLNEGNFLSSRGKAAARSADNTLTVSDFRRRLERVSKLVLALDRPEAAQWNGEALAAEANRWWRKQLNAGSG